MSQPLSLPITAVTLMEDRANIRRVASLSLEAGSHRFLVCGVSPIISDKTLHGRLRGAEGKILDLRVIRRPRQSSERPDSSSQEAWRRVEQQRESVASAERERERLANTHLHYNALAAQWSQETALDASFAKVEPERWKTDWQALKDQVAELVERRNQADHRCQRERQLLEDVTRQYQLLQSPSGEIEANLELTVVMEQGGEVEISVEYCVANACWRPHHVAEWSGARVQFRAGACVWQNTGEAWDGITLFFSTERSTLGTEPPGLQGDLLYTQPKQKRTTVVAREQSVHHLEERMSGVPGIDSGGETLRFAPSGTFSLPSDGRPHQVPLTTFEAPAREERVLMGELRREIFVRTKLENASGGPVLAGPVDLIKECGLVGRGYLEYAAPGETFGVSWGPHPELRCFREDKSGPEEKSALSGWRTREHYVEIHLSNLGPDTQSVEVLERLPVSELKGVKVEQDLAKTTDRVAQDNNGFVRFPVQLPPFGRKTITVGYLLSRRGDVDGL